MENVQIEAAADRLSVTVSQKETAPEGYTLVHRERELADFTESFQFRAPIDVSAVEAKSRDGVLTIKVPRLASPLRSGDPMNTQTIHTPQTPNVDVWRAHEGWRPVAELPGARADSVKVTAERGNLTVYAESEGHSFKRSFTLPDDVDAERIVARLERGLLTLTLPRVPTARSRQIRVESA